jgi:putative hydrolase of the HAD superfamily
MRRFFEDAGILLGDGLVELAGETYCTGGRGVAAPLRHGAVELLQALRAQGLRLGAISNTVQPGRYMRLAMIQRGLAEFFETQVYSSDVRVAKPHPAIFRMALDALGVAASQAIYVGDRLEAGVAGAQRVGIKGVLIEVGHRVEHHPEIIPDARIRALPELLDVLPLIMQG